MSQGRCSRQRELGCCYLDALSYGCLGRVAGEPSGLGFPRLAPFAAMLPLPWFWLSMWLPPGDGTGAVLVSHAVPATLSSYS